MKKEIKILKEEMMNLEQLDKISGGRRGVPCKNSLTVVKKVINWIKNLF